MERERERDACVCVWIFFSWGHVLCTLMNLEKKSFMVAIRKCFLLSFSGLDCPGQTGKKKPLPLMPLNKYVPLGSSLYLSTELFP